MTKTPPNLPIAPMLVPYFDAWGRAATMSMRLHEQEDPALASPEARTIEHLRVLSQALIDGQVILEHVQGAFVAYKTSVDPDGTGKDPYVHAVLFQVENARRFLSHMAVDIYGAVQDANRRLEAMRAHDDEVPK